MFDESARASEERASHVLFDETARNKQEKSKKRARREARKGPKAHSLLRNDAPVVLVYGAPVPVLLKQSFECRLDGRSRPSPNHSRSFDFFRQNRLAIRIVDVGSSLGSFPLVLD